MSRDRMKFDPKGYSVIGKTTEKLLNNAKKGKVDPKQDLDREGGATRTDRNPKKK